MDLPSSSPRSEPREASKSEKDSATDVVSKSFPPFNHVGMIVQPFDQEVKRDEQFQNELSTMLLELMLDFHAWAAARPSTEAERNAELLEKGINGLLETEKEQGMLSISELLLLLVEKTRQRLNDFVVRIKLALAALTGLTST
ncbi:hypothetical protein EIP91_010532 [Steccherinum ochraceum]|uniref:Uncharacterized protein n=1 Tax=Steccherinum ochraceum TaxID=92696 RepID=A0A4R0RCM8_9APHY|nr:hypothetical protein EIP91_010532 [Steccherinum ochraceum]